MFCKTLLGRPDGGQQDEVSKRYLPANLCRHDKITLQNPTLLYSQLLVKKHFWSNTTGLSTKANIYISIIDHAVNFFLYVAQHIMNAS